MVEVYVYHDRLSRDLKTKEGGTYLGTATSAAELDRIIDSHQGAFGYFYEDIALDSYEHALETLGVDPQVYLS